MSLQKYRVIFAGTVAGFLILCNLVYLSATTPQKQAEYAAKIDQPSIQILSLLLLIGIIAFAIIKPDQVPEEDK